MWHSVRMLMRGRGRQEIRIPVGLSSINAQAALKASSISLGTLGPESLLFGYNDV
jgi:hypothetical protein